MIPFVPPSLTYAWKHASFPYLGAEVERSHAVLMHLHSTGALMEHNIQDGWILEYELKTPPRQREQFLRESLDLGNLGLGIFANEHRDHRNYYRRYRSFSTSCSCCCDAS